MMASLTINQHREAHQFIYMIYFPGLLPLTVFFSCRVLGIVPLSLGTTFSPAVRANNDDKVPMIAKILQANVVSRKDKLGKFAVGMM